MRPARSAVLAGLAVLSTVAGILAPAAPASQTPYTVTALTFTVTGLPNETTGVGTQSCTIVGDLYRPRSATAAHREPAILTTNGFGGSKADQASLGRFAASNGYVVLSYSGLGFGGSGCRISLDDPSYDGVAGSQLVSFLGGKPGIAKDSNGKPYNVDFVRLDHRAHDGKVHAYDPRVGMVGGSYGGQIQFAVADVDPRMDTIVPIITWNDLSYSLAPNNTAFVHGVTYADNAPGTEKFDWTSAFFALGIVDGLQGARVDPSRTVGCVNFLQEACKSKAELDAGGFATQDVLDFARHASVESYMRNIRIPTLLMQGEADTLFNLNEAAATYRALKQQGTPVKMIWQSWGHSDGTSAKGEFSDGADALSTYEGRRVFAWFARYLKDQPVDTGPGFAFYRSWVPFSGSGPDTVQYGTSPSYPVGSPVRLYFSGSSGLVGSLTHVTSGTAAYTNVGGGVPTSYSETSALQGGQVPNQQTPPRDTAGTFASWKTAPLTTNLDVAGIPVVTLHLSAPTTSSAAPATELLLFAKLYDVAPDGSVELVHRLVSPVRVLDASKPVSITLPGIVHRFPKGHSIEFVSAATDAAYKNSIPVQPVTVSTSRTAPSSITLPALSPTQARRALTPASPRRSNPATASSALPASGGGASAGSVGAMLVALGLAAFAIRRRRPATRGL